MLHHHLHHLGQNYFPIHHCLSQNNFHLILNEWLTIRNPRELSRIAAERKHTMHLLPYGIPICIGSIAYFAFQGTLI